MLITAPKSWQDGALGLAPCGGCQIYPYLWSLRVVTCMWRMLILYSIVIRLSFYATFLQGLNVNETSTKEYIPLHILYQKRAAIKSPARNS
jgi:uncharacterized membrane protein YadS